MDILGVGPLELLFIFLIALIVLGPKDMAKVGRTLGRFMYKVVTSPTWQSFRQASRDLRQLPTKLMRDAGLEEQELQKLSKEIGLKDGSFPVSRQDLSLSSWTTPTATQASIASPVEAEAGDRSIVEAEPPGKEDEEVLLTSPEPPEAQSDQAPSPTEPAADLPSGLGTTQETETP